MKENIIRDYFQAWIDIDLNIIKETFSHDIVSSECYGPKYHGISEVIQWFKDWNEKGHVSG